MKYALELLEAQRTKIVEEMRQGAHRLADLQAIDKALSWLKVIDEHELEGAWKYDVHQLPVQEVGVAHYHLMIDTDYDGFDDPTDWSLYKSQDGEELEVGMLDWIITRKKTN